MTNIYSKYRFQAGATFPNLTPNQLLSLDDNGNITTTPPPTTQYQEYLYSSSVSSIEITHNWGLKPFVIILSLDGLQALEGVVSFPDDDTVSISFNPPSTCRVILYGGITSGSAPTTPDAIQSVFGRVGVITAQAGDYTASQVGADPSGTAEFLVTTHSNTPGLHLGSGVVTNSHISDAALIDWSKVSKTGALPSDVGALSSSNNLSDLLDVAFARSNIGASTASWNANQLQGRPVSNTSPSNNQALVWNSTSSSWEPGTVASDVLGSSLTGLSPSAQVVSSSHTLIQGISYLQGQLNNITFTAGYFNGGNSTSADATLGLLSNYQLSFLTNNLRRLSISNNGAVNIWDGTNRHAISNNWMPAASLTVGSTSLAMGQPGQTSSNTAGFLFECNNDFFFKGNDAGTVFEFLSYRRSSGQRRITLGDQTSSLTQQLLFKTSHYFEFSNTYGYNTDSFSGSTLPPIYTANDPRSSVYIRGRHPLLCLQPDNYNNTSLGPVIQFSSLDSDNFTLQSWKIGTATRDARFLDWGWYSTTDAVNSNPHFGIRNHTSNTALTIIAPGKSQNNALGNNYGFGFNSVLEPQYTLHVNGSIGVGTYYGNIGELKTDSNSKFSIDTPGDWDLYLKRNRQDRIRFESSRTTISPSFTSFNSTDANRTYIFGRLICKSDPNDEDTLLFNPYNDPIGAPNVYIERLQVGARGTSSTQHPAILRMHSGFSGSPFDFYKLNNTLYLRRATDQSQVDEDNAGFRFRVQNMALCVERNMLLGTTNARDTLETDGTVTLNIHHSSEPSIHFTTDNVGGGGDVVKARIRLNDGAWWGDRGMFLGTKTNHALNFIHSDSTRFIIKLDQFLSRNNGSDALPCLSSYDDPDTGIRWGANNTIYFSAGGSNRATLNTTELQAVRFVSTNRPSVTTLSTLQAGASSSQVLDKVNELVSKLNEVINALSAVNSSHSKLFN